MTLRLVLDRADQEILREALGYMSRRLFDPRDTDHLGEMEDQLDALLTRGDASTSAALVLGGDHVRVLHRVLDGYCSELSHPSADRSNRARVARMRSVQRRLRSQATWFGRMIGWIKSRW